MADRLVSVVVVGYGKSPALRECVDALLRSIGVRVEVLVVDNALAEAGRLSVEELHGVTVVGPSTNRGFAGGCNAGAARATGDVLAFVNDDAFVAPDALARLVAALEEPGVGIASASLRLDDEPELMNSAGNPVHFSGLSWAGGFRQPASSFAESRDIASATGAAFALTRELWDRLDGFDEAYFAYMEDADLSLRTWQAGLRVVYVPDAVVRHRYEFSRNDAKLGLIERNRASFLLVDYERRTLVVLLPALVLVELAVLAQSLIGGWIGKKLAAYAWLVRHRAHLRRRRRVVQAQRVVPDHDLLWLFEARIEPDNVGRPPGLGLLNAVLATYWRWARRRLSGS